MCLGFFYKFWVWICFKQQETLEKKSQWYVQMVNEVPLGSIPNQIESSTQKSELHKW